MSVAKKPFNKWLRVGLWILAGLTAMLVLAACGGASRAQARGVVLVEAEAVKVGDTTCAKIALERQDIELARACEDAYNIARGALVVAALAVDQWDEGKREDVACNVSKANASLQKIVSTLRARKADIPKILDDAIEIANSIGGCKS